MEFAIIAPVLVLLLCAIIEFGLAISSYFVVQEGVLAGSNYASRKGWDSAAIPATVKASSPKLASATVSARAFCSCPSGNALGTEIACVAGATSLTCPADCSTVCTDGFVHRKYVAISASVPRTKVMGQTFGLPDTISITMKAKLP